MVQVVCCDPADQERCTVAFPADGARQPSTVETANRFLQTAVFADEQADVVLPRRFARCARRAHEPVTAFERERTALLACQPAPNRVLPVCRMDREFPDVVPSERRPYSRPLRR